MEEKRLDEIDCACADVEACLEKLEHLTDAYLENYNLYSTNEMNEIEKDMFAQKRDGMRIDIDIIFDYVVVTISLMKKVREAAGV